MIEVAKAEDDEGKLAIMYQTFVEVMKRTAGESVESFKAKTPSGTVKTFSSVDEYLGVIKADKDA